MAKFIKSYFSEKIIPIILLFLCLFFGYGFFLFSHNELKKNEK